MKFTEDMMSITIELKTLKAILLGDREGLKRLITIVNEQFFTASDTDYFNKLQNPSKMLEVAWEGDEFTGEPLCHEPELLNDFKKYLNADKVQPNNTVHKPEDFELPEPDFDFDLLDDPFISHTESKG